MDLRAKKNAQLADYIIEIMPGIELNVQRKPDIDPEAAKNLFAIWKNEKNKVKKDTYKRPETMSKYQLDAMVKEGLVNQVGNRLEITDKGSKAIRTMLLGDDSSIFDRDEDQIDYSTAEAKTKNAHNTGKSLSKQASDIWWSRFE
jgi:hypothetical protein